MLHDAGRLTICRREGGSLESRLVPLFVCWYGEKTVGMSRYYAAAQANVRADMLVQVESNSALAADLYAVAEAGEQYRIVQVQRVADEDGLPWMDLTLERLGTNYDTDFESAGEPALPGA